MTWREDLRRVTIGGKSLIGASFRGIPFLVEISEYSGGRRVVVHEFPLRDEPYAEDLGAKAHPFRVEGYVIGDGYLAAKTALQDALDAFGPGELVHPFHGVRRAVCAGYSVRETRADGGMATFAIEFTETPAQEPVPIEVIDAAEQVADAADTAIEAANAELAEQYDASGLPSFALASAEAAVTRAADGLEAALAPVVTGEQELAALTGRIALLTIRAASLVRAPADILGEFGEIITGLADTAAAAPGAMLDALLDAYDVDLGDPVDPITSTRERELVNQAAFTGGLRRLIAAEAARLAPLVPYASIEEATAARDRVAAALEEQATAAGDAAYPALVSLRSEVLRAVPGGLAFARVVTVTRNTAIPSLLLAYQLYGDVDSEADILARNPIRHPGFIAGDLKVLSDV